MRLEIRREYVGEQFRYFIDLYKGDFGSTGSAPVGTYVSTLELEHGLSIDHSMVTFREDGREARAAGRKNALWTFIKLSINPFGLSATTNPGDSIKNSGRVFPPKYISEEESGSPSGGVHIIERTELGSDAYPTHGNGIEDVVNTTGGVYIFDRRGKAIDINATTSKKTTQYYRRYHSLSTAIRDDKGGLISSITETDLSVERIETTTYPSGGSEVTAVFRESYSHRDEAVQSADPDGGFVYNSQISGGRYSRVVLRLGGEVISDPCYGFSIMSSELHDVETVHEHYMQMPEPGPYGYPDVGRISYRLISEKTTRRNELVVIRRDSMVETIPYEYHPARIHVAFVAADPMTGALVVNVQEKMGFTVERSWIFVVDDQSVRRLHEIMDIPTGTNVRVRSNRGLISV